MKKTVLLFAVLFTMATAAGAATSTVQGRLDESAAALDQEGSEPGGTKLVTDRLSKEFGVSEAEVNELRGRHLGFGEIAIALSLAKGMPGGATDENIDKVIELRETHPRTGWGVVAKELDLKLGPTESRLHRIARPSDRETQEAAGKDEGRVEAKAQKNKDDQSTAELDVKADRLDRPERPDKADRPERPDIMGHR